ncbi:MAG: hypothetical protein EHM48_05580 [Planctomycetaceae bacterium]|nr:MAG: hypothetical protein EHM48_05580 [Planctomycetaceae bacterium]
MPNYDLLQSVGRALDILELVGNSESGMSWRLVVDRTHLSNTTAFNMLRALVAKGFLVKRRNPIRYYPGPVLINFRRAQRDYELFQRAKPVLMNLANSFIGEARLCECVGLRILSMLMVAAGQLGVMQPHLPHFMRPYGIGSVFQAYWDKQQLADYEKNVPFAKHGKKKWGSRENFHRFLSGFRKNRVAMLPVYRSGDIFRVAAPIFGPGGNVVAIVCLIKPIAQTNATFRHKCCQAIRKAGVELSFDS